MAIDPDCDGFSPPAILDPWNLRIEWQWSTTPQEYGVVVMPAVGNLTDDDGDGRITANDDPDVAFTTWNLFGPERLVALNGTDGTEIFSRNGYYGSAGVAIADVTGDGWTEIVAVTSDRRIAAVDASGTQLWSTAAPGLGDLSETTVADFDNDGDAEVIVDNTIVDGATGARVATIAGVQTPWRTPAVGDLDLDGSREIVLGEVVARPDGSIAWTNGGFGDGNFAALASVDADPEGEVLFVSGATLYVHDADGTLLGTWPLLGTNPGPPAVADFDGDGDVEIAIPAGATLAVHELDGSVRWSAPIRDLSGLAGCSGYDVDGDGAYEVLFADEQDLMLFDGRTGAVLYRNGAHDSSTLWEYPVVADADNDGSAEILVASNSTFGGNRGVTMFGHAGSGWSKSGPTWGTHDFAVTNVLADGSVPTDEAPSWQVHNTFRARPTVDAPGRPDPFLTVGEPCVTACTAEGVLQIPWQIGNGAGWELPEGAVVRLYGAGPEPLAEASLAAIAGGELLAGGVFEVPGDALAGAERWVVRLEGADVDCHPGDVEVEGPSPCE